MPFLSTKKKSETAVPLVQQLEQSHAELMQIFEESSIGMAIVSLDGKWIKVNQYLCDLLGYSKEELVTKKFNDITHPDDLHIGSDMLKKVMNGEIQKFEIEKRYVKKNGNIIHVLINSSIIKNLDGSPKYLISQTKDVTHLIMSMDALSLSEEKFRLVFENAPVGITHFDREGNITMVNQVLADILGSSVEKITRLNTRKNVKDNKQKAAFEAALNGKMGHFEGSYTSVTGGKTAYLKAIYAPLFDSSKSVIGGIAITEDISDEKAQEKKLIASIHEKELLLQEVYHRVKNNLQTIISLINIQMSESLNPEFTEGLRETKSRLYAMSKVHEVLCRTGNFVSISLSDYVRNLSNNFDYPHVRYQIKIDQDVSLTVDQTNTLGIIINELVTNSVKHNIGQDLIIRLVFSLNEQNVLSFHYSDDGIGMGQSVSKFSSSLGMNLVKLLIEDQLGGKLNYLKEKGFHLQVEFSTGR